MSYSEIYTTVAAKTQNASEPPLDRLNTPPSHRGLDGDSKGRMLAGDSAVAAGGLSPDRSPGCHICFASSVKRCRLPCGHELACRSCLAAVALHLGNGESLACPWCRQVSGLPPQTLSPLPPIRSLKEQDFNAVAESTPGDGGRGRTSKELARPLLPDLASNSDDTADSCSNTRPPAPSAPRLEALDDSCQSVRTDSASYDVGAAEVTAATTTWMERPVDGNKVSQRAKSPSVDRFRDAAERPNRSGWRGRRALAHLRSVVERLFPWLRMKKGTRRRCGTPHCGNFMTVERGDERPSTTLCSHCVAVHQLFVGYKVPCSDLLAEAARAVH